MTTPPPPPPPPPPPAPPPPPPAAPSSIGSPSPTPIPASADPVGAAHDRGPATPGHSRRRLVVGVGVALLVAALAVVAVVVTGGDDEPTPIALDAAVDAVDELDSLLVDARVDAVEAGDSLAVDLEPCPLGDLDDVWAFAPDDLVVPESDGTTKTTAFTFLDDEDEPISYQCYVVDDEASGNVLGVLVGRASDRSHRSYLRRTLSFGDVSFGEAAEHRGGELVPYCVDAGEVDGLSFCAADWVTEEVVLGVYLTVDEDQLPLVQELLVASLDHLVEQLLANAGDVEIVEE